MSVLFRCAAALGLVALAAAPPTNAQTSGTSPTGFYVEPVTPPGSIFDAVDVEVAADGRIFVLAKPGRLHVVLPDGTLIDEPWLTLGREVLNVAERGLLGFALHPDFPATPDIYFVHTIDDSPDPRPEEYTRAYNRVLRFSADPDNPNKADLSSRHVVLGENFHDGIPSCANFHSIGTIEFGHDGSLFVGAGDAAPPHDPIDAGGLYDECFSEDPARGVHPSQDIGSFRAQSLESLAGKILRIDPETGEGYPDNPFYTGDPTDPASKVWALGFRNPFRFTVLPATPGEDGPGTLFVGDVGQSTYEEINRVTGGENFGWPCFEGPAPYPIGQAETGPLSCSNERAGVPTLPYAYWHHNDPDLSSPSGATAYSITGGTVYTGTAYPEAYHGALFFADYAQQWVRAAHIAPAGLESVLEVGEGFGNVVDLALEPATGELIAADIIDNHIVRIRHAGGAGSPPVARLDASRLTAGAGDAVAFSATGSFDPDGGALAFRWTFGDGATAEGAEAVHTYAEPGVYAVTVVATDGDGLESRATASIRVGRAAPVPEIVEPTAYVIPTDGRLEVAATASDPVDADETFAYAWAVDLYHNDHVHERWFTAEEAAAAFVLEPHGDAGETSFYRATLTVTDGEGLTATASRTLRSPVPAEIDVTSAAPLQAVEGGVEIAFPRPVRVGRVGVPGLAEAPGGLAVEVRQGGEWGPVRYPSVLPEGDTLQVIFVEVEADAVRLLGADTLAVYAHVDAEAELPGAVEGNDVGVPAATGRSGLGPSGDLVVVGGGAVGAGSFQMARRVLVGDGSVTARVDALTAAEPTGGAGIAMRAGLDAWDPGVTFLAEPGGTLALWAPAADGRPARTAVGAWDGPVWLRLRRSGVRVTAETSADGTAWEAVWTRFVGLPAPLWGGPAVAAGDLDGRGARAVGWFGEVAFETGTANPPAPEDGPFSLEGVYPNPSRTTAALVVDAGRAGRYEAELVDLLGRVVWRGAPASTAEVRQLMLPLDVEVVGAGAYVVRVRHVESGETRTETITVVR